jgi:hypothetical protein
MTAGAKVNSTKEKRAKVSQTDFANTTLEVALRIPRAIWENYAGKGAAPHDIAMALDLSPTSGGWRNLCGSSIAYGFTEGGYAASQITLTDLGRRLVAPTEEGDDDAALIEALLKPKVQREFYEKYNKAKFPKEEIGRNVLISLGLPKDRAERAFEILRENGKFAGVIRDTKTGPFVALEIGGAKGAKQAISQLEELGEEGGALESTKADSLFEVFSGDTREKKSQLFVAHGKKVKSLDDLKKILGEFKIPYKVAVDEPHKGRPISNKVAELMNECSAGIFVFTKDEKFLKQSDSGELTEVWRPSENVVYELGAASILWDKKIIIVREDGVNFPSDFSDLGYITFKDGEIGSKALEIFKELIAFDLPLIFDPARTRVSTVVTPMGAV